MLPEEVMLPGHEFRRRGGQSTQRNGEKLAKLGNVSRREHLLEASRNMEHNF